MSRIQRAIDAAAQKRARSAEQSPPGARAGTTTTYSSLSNLFKGLRGARLESRVLERNKLLPAIEDRRAVTAYKMLRTRVLQRMRAQHWQTLVVTGAGPGEGKTLTACNLALSIAEDVNQSVILVDLDLQRPTMATYFGIEVGKGMSDYLRGEADIADVIYAPQSLERLVLAPNGDTVTNASELLASPRMHEFLAWAKDPSRDSIVVFDMPPVLACDDVLAFSPNADAVLLVASEGMTSRTALQDTLEMLTSCNLIGVVMNRSSEDRGSKYDYYY